MKNKKSTTSGNTGKIIGAAVGGALVGAALGVLFAPEKGSVTRGKIAGEAKKLGENMKKKMGEEIDQDTQA